MLSDLVRRWIPCQQPLPDELVAIRRRVREYFDRLFGTAE